MVVHCLSLVCPSLVYVVFSTQQNAQKLLGIVRLDRHTGTTSFGFFDSPEDDVWWLFWIPARKPFSLE